MSSECILSDASCHDDKPPDRPLDIHTGLLRGQPARSAMPSSLPGFYMLQHVCCLLTCSEMDISMACFDLSKHALRSDEVAVQLPQHCWCIASELAWKSPCPFGVIPCISLKAWGSAAECMMLLVAPSGEALQAYIYIRADHLALQHRRSPLHIVFISCTCCFGPPSGYSNCRLHCHLEVKEPHEQATPH